MRILDCGDSAVLVELADLDEVLGCYAALVERPPPHVVDLVPAARTVLVRVRPGPGVLAEVRAALAGLRPRAGARADGGLVEVPVHYDGADLADVAELTGLSEAEVVAAHTGREWRVAFCGFAPGFGYLVGGDPRLKVPRREQSRVRVPAGSVALAGEFSGVYPRSSPGGWQLLGRTELAVWDPGREPAALLAPGVRVRFVDAGGSAARGPGGRSAGRADTAAPGGAARGRPDGGTGSGGPGSCVTASAGPASAAPVSGATAPRSVFPSSAAEKKPPPAQGGDPDTHSSVPDVRGASRYPLVVDGRAAAGGPVDGGVRERAAPGRSAAAAAVDR
ncbi:KipI family sensor histidine kinase inhibitor [Allonocardiopsis opalescens]|uniref:KipI family sensor histidine kinase inhibitor n=1 Tax=Allonocardiopsis opalescens TaxID=1144618 RepID=A0A2T0PUB9_9ACTN|nr:KipI family sensor histidine kinase inhibitor [Allonocardiopsis opalescens]